MQKAVLWLCVVACAGIAGTTRPGATGETGGQEDGFRGPYCGLYALYAAARLNGLPPQDDGILPLLKPEYIGSPVGASAAELEAGAAELGMAARTFSGMTRFDLFALPDPAILHVKSDLSIERADHWMLLVSAGPAESVVIDEGPVPEKIATSLLCARWDGVAVVVGSQAPAPFVRWPTLLVALGGVGSLVLLSMVSQRIAKTRFDTPRQRRRAELLAPAGLVLLIAVTCAAVDRNQPVWPTEARVAVLDRHIGKFLPTFSVEELEHWVADPSRNVILVDARDTSDFRDGYIPGARNLPVYATDAQLAAFVEEVQPGQRVVIYCQSAQCTFSDIVAARLRNAGLDQLAIYHDGYAGWTSSNRPTTQWTADERL